MDDKYLTRLLTAVTVIVTLAWAVTFLAPLVRSDYDPPQEVNIVMMAVVGLFVQLLLKVRNPKDSEDDRNE